MSVTQKHVGFAEAIRVGEEVKYREEIEALSSLSPEQAETEARKLVRR